MDCFQHASYRNIQIIPLKARCDIEHVTTQSFAFKLSQTCQGAPACIYKTSQGPQCQLMLQGVLCCWNRIMALTFCSSPHIRLAHVSNKVGVY